MPICGDTIRAQSIIHAPKWVCHGERDHIIAISALQKIVDALKKAGAPELGFSAHKEEGPDSWTRACGKMKF